MAERGGNWTADRARVSHESSTAALGSSALRALPGLGLLDLGSGTSPGAPGHNALSARRFRRLLTPPHGKCGPGIRSRSGQPHPQRAENGFTLVEILVSIALISGAIVALLHSLTLAVGVYSRSQVQWRSTTELWNRANQIRGEAVAEEATAIFPIPGARPLYRVILEQESGERSIRWEVLRAQR
ncbi:MAG: type II secretion system protein [Acidobacteriota bacterium]